ncbi:hypothetical protein RFI_24310 [Reticulomyxa filosa]|uniref:25S rRNA (uridine-N(3))-methyltransferase BMT5-like domain-containing protein n=1 Tax=Reticulomyxa filosa TaxID=46433 RepID=X6MGB3_RETFI|nr:hypothetical protein RFI_24310 [Reticulomyxa filosa]|eukprot:ETO13063.1 hypothetical protein RFI_24310 [Reticulomyxa filosa]
MGKRRNARNKQKSFAQKKKEHKLNGLSSSFVVINPSMFQSNEEHEDNSLAVSSVLGCQVNPNPSKMNHYTKNHRLLLIGEGDFSFASSLACHLHFNSIPKVGNLKASIKHAKPVNLTIAELNKLHTMPLMIATSYDSYSECISKYGTSAESSWDFSFERGGSTNGNNNSKALLFVYNINLLNRSNGVLILHSIDATKWSDEFAQIRETIGGEFDYIIFNFPHIGGGSNREDVEKNKAVISEFITNCWPLLRQTTTISTNKVSTPKQKQLGEIHIRLRDNAFYNSWKVNTLANMPPPFPSCTVRVENNDLIDTFKGYAPVRTHPHVRDPPTVDNGVKLYRFIPSSSSKTHKNIPPSPSPSQAQEKIPPASSQAKKKTSNSSNLSHPPNVVAKKEIAKDCHQKCKVKKKTNSKNFKKLNVMQSNCLNHLKCVLLQNYILFLFCFLEKSLQSN